MSKKPPVNPNVDAIADRAKYSFYTATQLLAATQYRLGELAGTSPADEIPADPPRPTDFGALRRRLGQGGIDDGHEADPTDG